MGGCAEGNVKGVTVINIEERHMHESNVLVRAMEQRLDLHLIARVHTSKHFNRITAITPLDFSPISRLRELKHTKLAVVLNALSQRCTS